MGILLAARSKGTSLLALRRTAAAALALSVGVVLVMASVASAEPVVGPEGSAFYTPPSLTPAGTTGELIWYRPATLNLSVPLPANKAWTVLYQSTDQQGKPDAVTGTVAVPTTEWKGKGPRPVVTIGIGTQGLANKCAPSKQMQEGTEYDGAETVAALKAGYAVAITDYQGYTNGAAPTYIAGKAEGQAVLDIVRAARQLPESGVTEATPAIAWGYSQGGQAVGWAGELQPTYAPDVKLIAVAAGGVPSNLQSVASFGSGSVAAAFSIDSVIGLATAYPSFPLGVVGSLEALKAEVKLKSMCAIQSIEEFRDTNFAKLTNGEKTLEQEEESLPMIKTILEEQSLATKPISVPVYHYHGLEDEFVPVTQDVELHQAWCSMGVTDDFQLYPGDHLLTDPTAVPTVLKWIEERVAGKKAPSTCGDHAPSAALPSTARLTPMTGDLIIPLPAWTLKGQVKEKSGLAIEVPAGATLSAEGDVTNETLTASLSIPPLNQTMRVLGIPVNVKGALKQVGAIEGAVSLSNAGVLSQSAVAHTSLEIGSIALGLIRIPVGCKTVEPIALPLAVSEPANALYTGGFSFAAEITVPAFGGCGLLGPVITPLVGGSGNTAELTAAPPAPINW